MEDIKIDKALAIFERCPIGWGCLLKLDIEAMEVIPSELSRDPSSLKWNRIKWDLDNYWRTSCKMLNEKEIDLGFYTEIDLRNKYHLSLRDCIEILARKAYQEYFSSKEEYEWAQRRTKELRDEGLSDKEIAKKLYPATADYVEELLEIIKRGKNK